MTATECRCNANDAMMKCNKQIKHTTTAKNMEGFWRTGLGALHGLLGPPPVPIFWYISHFDLEKNKERTFGTESRCLEAELGQEQFCPPVERFRRENFPPRGGNHRHHHHQQLSHLGEGNLHQHLQQHHLLSNPSSSLVFNLRTETIYCC